MPSAAEYKALGEAIGRQGVKALVEKLAQDQIAMFQERVNSAPPAVLTRPPFKMEVSDVVQPAAAMPLMKDEGDGGKAPLAAGGETPAEGTHTSPIAMDNTDTDSEHSDTWDRTNQGANDGVTVNVYTRLWDSGGVGHITFRWRQFTFDSKGCLVLIGTENKFDKNALEA